MTALYSTLSFVPQRGSKSQSFITSATLSCLYYSYSYNKPSALLSLFSNSVCRYLSPLSLTDSCVQRARLTIYTQRTNNDNNNKRFVAVLRPLLYHLCQNKGPLHYVMNPQTRTC